MKKYLAPIAAAIVIALSSCGNDTGTQVQGGTENTEGDEQVQEPVVNSGPETEMERATDAVRDSSNAGDDTPSTKGPVPPSTK